MILRALFCALSICFLMSCGNKAACHKEQAKTSSQSDEAPKYSDKPGHYGVEITKNGAMQMADLTTKVAEYGSGAVRLKAEISDVCSVKGCWMTLKNDDGEDVRVTFKDYGFFVPKDVTGKIAYVEGIAKMDTTSIADLKHFAEDAGQSAAEIAQITAPEVAVTFEATGVIIE